MGIEIDRINAVLDKLELSQHQAATAICLETEYVISQSTISRVLKGESRDGMAAFVRYALENIDAKREEPKPDGYLGCHEISEDAESYTLTYFVRAESAAEAISKLREWGYNVDGYRIISDHDCTGQWFAAPANERTTTFLPALQAWAVSMNWQMDV